MKPDGGDATGDANLLSEFVQNENVSAGFCAVDLVDLHSIFHLPVVESSRSTGLRVALQFGLA